MASTPIYSYSDVTPAIEALAARSLQNSCIDPDDYVRYDVKRGLRDLNGKGVLAGLTEISDIVSKKMVDGEEIPCEGELYYRGYSIQDLVGSALREKRFGFEDRLPASLRSASHGDGALRLFRPALLLPHASKKLCPGRHPQVPHPGYDELPGQMRSLHRIL